MPKSEEYRQARDLKYEYLGRCCAAAEKSCDDHTAGRLTRVLAGRLKTCDEALKSLEKANDAYAMSDPTNYTDSVIAMAHARVTKLQDMVSKYDEMYEDEMERKKDREAKTNPPKQTITAPHVDSYVQAPPKIPEEADANYMKFWRRQWDSFKAASGVTDRKAFAVFLQACSPGFLTFLETAVRADLDGSTSPEEIIDAVEAFYEGKTYRDTHKDWQAVIGFTQGAMDRNALRMAWARAKERVDFYNASHEDIEMAIILKCLRNPEERKAIIDHRPKLQPNDVWGFLEAKDFSSPSAKKPMSIKAVSEAASRPATTPEAPVSSAPTPSSTSQPSGPYLRCESKKWHDKSACPAFKSPCGNCAKPGHTAAACLQPGGGAHAVMRVHFEKNPVAVVKTGQESAVIVASISTRDTDLAVDCAVTADTGAGACIVCEDTFNEHFPGTELSPPLQTLVTVGGAELQQTSVFVAAFVIEGNDASAMVHVTKDVEGFYLSLRTCKYLYLVHESFPRPFKVKKQHDEKFSSASKSMSPEPVSRSKVAKSCVDSVEFRLLQESGTLETPPTMTSSVNKRSRKRGRPAKQNVGKECKQIGQASKAESKSINGHSSHVTGKTSTAHARTGHVTTETPTAHAREGHVTPAKPTAHARRNRGKRTAAPPGRSGGSSVIAAIRANFRDQAAAAAKNKPVYWDLGPIKMEKTLRKERLAADQTLVGEVTCDDVTEQTPAD